MPNKHDGDGYSELMSLENGIEIYGAWALILQVASKCKEIAPGCGGRGTLLRDSARAHNAASIARQTRGNPKIFEMAIPILLAIGWLELSEIEVPDTAVDTQIPQPGAVTSHLGAVTSHDGASSRARAEGKGIEGNGMEEKGTEVSHIPAKAPSSDQGYHSNSRTALYILNELSGAHFRETDQNLAVISDRLSEPGVSIEGVRTMIERQCKLWKGTEQANFLRPSTLFAKDKFDSYYGTKDLPIVIGGPKAVDNNRGTLKRPNDYANVVQPPTA